QVAGAIFFLFKSDRCGYNNARCYRGQGIAPRATRSLRHSIPDTGGLTTAFSLKTAKRCASN
ncbi:MAG: hypothetical protein DRP56_07305, partial [Planctomycetota bacterium]